MDPKFHWIQACAKDRHPKLYQTHWSYRKKLHKFLLKDTLQMLHGSGELLQSADLQLNRLDEIQIDWERVIHYHKNDYKFYLFKYFSTNTEK